MHLTFHPLTIAQIRPETRDAVSLTFDIPKTLAKTFTFQPGQYLTLRAQIDGEDIRRNYSICASPLDNELRIAVKLLPGGKFSTHANKILKPGDIIEVLPPAGHFTTRFAPEQSHNYAAFAAGSGITPILSLIKTALETEPASRFQLFYGNRTSAGILFLEQLAALKNRHMDRLDIHHFLSAEEDEIALLNGRLDAEKCREILNYLLDATSIEKFFICGPDGMMRAAEQTLRAHGVAPEKILLERFAAAPADPEQIQAAAAAARAAAGRQMSIQMEGRKSTVTFNAALGNILDSVRAAGLPAPYACKAGVCATCRAKLLSGQVDMKQNFGLTPQEVADGYILTCQSTPRGENVVITYDI